VEAGDYIIGSRQFEVDVSAETGPGLFVFKGCCRHLDIINIEGDRSPIVLPAWIDPSVTASNSASGLLRTTAKRGTTSSLTIPTSLDGGFVTLSPPESSGLASSAPDSPPEGSEGAFLLDVATNQVTWTPATPGMHAVSLRLSVPGSEKAFSTVSYVTTVLDIPCSPPYDDCVPTPVVKFQEEYDSFLFLRGGVEMQYDILADAFVPGEVQLEWTDLPEGASISFVAGNLDKGLALYQLSWAPARGQGDMEVCFTAFTDENTASLGKYCIDLEVIG